MARQAPGLGATHLDGGHSREPPELFSTNDADGDVALHLDPVTVGVHRSKSDDVPDRLRVTRLGRATEDDRDRFAGAQDSVDVRRPHQLRP